MFADLCILFLTAFQSSFPQRITKMIQEMQRVYLKVQACVFTWLPNKYVCIYDNKHASKQISWIDKFQNEKDIQLSLVKIMSFRYRAALLHWL